MLNRGLISRPAAYSHGIRTSASNRGSRLCLRQVCEITACLVLITSTIVNRTEAQTSSHLTKLEITSQYRLLKDRFEKLYHEEKFSQLDDKDLHQNIYVVDTCKGPPAADFVGERPEEGDDPVYDLSDTALVVVTWTNDLRRLGYPERIWRPLVDAYENSELAGLSSQNGPDDPYGTASDQLVAILNHYRHQFSPSLPRATRDEGCGAGDEGVMISTDPKDGRAFFIPVFFYKLCQAQKIDPNDTSRCDRWFEAMDGRLAYLAGAYHYLIRWSDGTVREGLLNFDKVGETEDYAFTAVFRKRPTQPLVFQKTSGGH
jgi:hypothetical protein